jgi:hypothetical protein
MNLSLFTDSKLPKFLSQIIVDHQLAEENCYLFHRQPFVRILSHAFLRQIVKIVTKEMTVAYNMIKVKFIMNDLPKPIMIEIFVRIVFQSVDFILYER